MVTVVKRQNMTIAIREYTDGNGNQKKVWKTIGELITWDNGNQSFELWGPTGSNRGLVFDQDGQRQTAQQQQAQPQGGFQQQPQQAPAQPSQPAQPAPGGVIDLDQDVPF